MSLLFVVVVVVVVVGCAGNGSNTMLSMGNGILICNSFKFWRQGNINVF